MNKILFRGMECYITESRITNSDKIEGFNYYEIRHDDESQGTPVTIEPGVMVNFWGTLATRVDFTEIEGLTEEGYVPERWYIDIKDSNDEETEEHEDETHLFYAGASYGSVIDETQIAIA